MASPGDAAPSTTPHRPRPGRSRRVLVAHPSADVYGSDLQLLESIAALQEAGWTVSLHVPAAGPLLDRLPALALRVDGFPVLQKALLRPVALLRLLACAPRDLVRLVRRIRAESPDVVYVNTVTIPMWLVAAKVARVPAVVHVHEAEEGLPKVVRLALTLPLRLARRVVANSASAAAVVVDAVASLARRTAVVPNGVPDPGPVADAEVEPGRVALVARLSPRKGVDVALDAVAMLRAEGRAVTLEVCGTAFGGYEWFEEQLRARAATADLAGAVTFRGYVSPTAPVLARASVVIVPSRVEPFGNTAVEALLARRPLVASDVQGLAEIVRDGETGVLVAPGDAAALAAGIAGVLDDPVRADALAAAGRDDAVRRFAGTRYRADIVAIVASVAAGDAPSKEH